MYILSSKPRLGRPPKYLRLEHPKPPPVDEPPEKKPRKKERKPEPTPIPETNEDKAMLFIEESKVVPAEKESWPKHSLFLKKYVPTDVDPRLWSNSEVVEFVSSLPSCRNDAAVFRREQIDGEAFLSLSQRDILRILKVKVGPAVKLYNSIVLLRQQVDQKVFT